MPSWKRGEGFALQAKVEGPQVSSAKTQMRKYADLRLADWKNKEIRRFGICVLIIKSLRICDSLASTPKKYADLQLRSL
jgi:hypothetical protein